jgi:lipoprotein NlpD
VVLPQDTLYGIAWRHNLDYRDLAKWNNIGSDYRLRVGQVLILQPAGGGAPVGGRGGGGSGAVRVAAPRPQEVPHVDKPTPLAESAGGPTPPRPTPNPAPYGGRVGGSGAVPNGNAAANSAAANSTAANSVTLKRPPTIAPALATGVNSHEPQTTLEGGSAKWVWPTDRLSAPRPVPGGGILLLGRLGQDVRAAGAGRVVYTGSGLRGYGNLIIIKHGETLLSSYAHNRELLVHEGQDVLAGQTIAHMGTGPHQICALYFEIRVNGKPIDPLRYLAAQ